jgi:hypothetical protein
MRRTFNLSLILAACGMSLLAQTPPSAPTTQTAPVTPAAAASAPPQVHADLNQLMRGVLYPAANVVFAAQADDPEELAKKNTGDPSMATDPIQAAWGGWQAIQNAALALAESANLLAIEGRRCTNGTLVPVSDPAWTKFVQNLRDTSMKAYAAAQAKSQDKISEVSEALSTSCTSCHRRWRDRRTPGRCQ